MSSDYLIGIDVGSSNVKLVIFDERCAVLASETSEYSTLVPQAGWTEYNPEDWWLGLKNTLSRALSKSSIDAHQIRAIGLSSLGCCPICSTVMETAFTMESRGPTTAPTVKWNGSGKPVAILFTAPA